MGKSWDVYQPSTEFLLEYLAAFVVISVTSVAFISRTHTLKTFLNASGVRVKRIKRAASEVERKTFHLCGLLVPTAHLLLLEAGVTERTCCHICWTVTLVGWASDLARLHVPFIARNWPLKAIMRDFERTQLTGGCFFSLGCTLAISLSPPS